MVTKDEVIEEFKLLLLENIKNIEMIVKTAKKLGLTNEQYYLDWEDSLNKISVGDYSEIN